VLQAFQAELLFDVRVAQLALIVVRPEAGSDSGPIVEATATIPQEPNGARIFFGTKSALDTLWRLTQDLTLNPKELTAYRRRAILGPDLVLKITRSRTTLPLLFFNQYDVFVYSL